MSSYLPGPEWPQMPNGGVPSAPPRERFRPLGGKAKWARGVLMLLAAVLIVRSLAYVNMIGVMRRVIRDGNVSEEMLLDTDNLMGLADLAMFVVIVVAVVLFAVWFRAAYRNLRAMGEKQRFRQGWAVWGWLVPIVCFWKPKQLINDIRVAAQRRDPATAVTAARMDYFWLLVVATWVLGGIPTNMYESAVTAGEMRAYGYAELVWTVLMLGYILAFVWYVGAVSVAQDRTAGTGDGEGDGVRSGSGPPEGPRAVSA